MLEGSSANDAFFLPHSATECAKILWRNGEAAAFYSVKMKGSLCGGTTSQCYLLPVLDTIFVQRKYRRGGLGMKMLHDFCQSFLAEDALGISCPISAAMYQGKSFDVDTLVCKKFLQAHPEEQKRLWEVEAPGDWGQRVNVWLKIQMESSPTGKAEVVSCMEKTPTTKPRQLDQMNKQKITDAEELNDYKLQKRKTFEDNIRKNRTIISNWIKYAQWEESLKKIQRAHSIYECALDVDYRNVTLWLKYAEMEMKNHQVNHARNIWDWAITILPRVNQFWYKYTYMEEMLGNVAGSRQVFERWMEWQPEEQAWHFYINLELRYKEVDRAQSIYERFVLVHPNVKNWINYTLFEEKHSYFAHVRKVYERAVEFFGEGHMDEHLYVAFAKFEEDQKEFERNYTIFEKKFGDRKGIEDIIVSKRRFQYEEEVKANPHNYDVWFDYLRLMESDTDAETVWEVFERAITNVPPIQEKCHWKRYIYLWINYALYEELEAKDAERTRQVYQACLELLPHKKFTIAKMWLLYAQFEIRQKNHPLARRALGTSIGKCPKNKLFKAYIVLELQLREFDRCRKLYEKFLEFAPENCMSWIKFAELETILGDTDCARAICELAIDQPQLDMPEVLWKSYIDFEIEQEEYEKTRSLYWWLLQRTQHITGVDCFPGVGQVAGDAMEKKDDTTAAGTLNSQGPEEEDLEQSAGNAQQHKGLRKREGPGDLVGDKATKQFKTTP
ncbi:Crooked neck-like protein 1 [Lonchura striata]|uniref:Crooked neck-like protein 1 n=1 Tax=Lonchura striata TaxID=40157 RepID=A0A218V0Y2_9PASE|nr:Crooked neck-like protein 1 [Lonchura striata domestica]